MIHAITATWAFDEAKKREALSRNCPECRQSQVTEEEQINEPVACENCGVEMPPLRAAADRKAEKAKGRAKK